MQRGIIQLNKNELRLVQLLAENSGVDLTSLRAKLELALTASEDLSRLEVNRDEVEAILDSLPAPTAEQDPSYLALRNKLQMFLGDGS